MSASAMVLADPSTVATRGPVAAAGRVLLLLAVPLSLVWIPVGHLAGLGNVAASDVVLLGLWVLSAVALLRGSAGLALPAASFALLAVCMAVLAGLGSALSLPQGRPSAEFLLFMKRFGLAAILPLATRVFSFRGMAPWMRWVTAATAISLAAFTLFPELQDRLPRPEEWEGAMDDRATGSVTNPNDLAYAAVALFVLHAALSPRRPRLIGTLVTAATLGASGYCLVSSGSRSGLIGAAAALAFLVGSSRVSLRAKMAIAAAATTVLVAGLSRSAVFEERVSRAYREGLQERNVYSRLDAQWLAARTAVGHPFGVGYTSFGEVTANERTYFVLGTSDSVYVDTLLAAGFLGLACLLTLFWRAWCQVRSAEHTGATRRNVLSAGLLAFFVFGLATVVPISVFLAPLFFSLVSAAAYPDDGAAQG